MMASTHVVFGLTCWVAFERVHGVDLLSSPATLLIASCSSLLPDIDTPKSRFGRMVPFLSYPISAIFGHRGITHSLFMVVIMMAAMLFYGHSNWFIAPLVVGYLSHLVGDVFTNSGAPLLWPNKDKVSIPVFDTGGFVEVVVRVALVAVLVAFFWTAGWHPHQ